MAEATAAELTAAKETAAAARRARTAQRLADAGYPEFKTWREYVGYQAEEHGVDLDTAISLFQMLGAAEAFDGFISAMQDAEGMDGLGAEDY